MSAVEVVYVPKKLVDEVGKKGIDIETFVVSLLVKKLGIDPKEEVEMYLELADEFFREGLGLVEKDPVQASEKLYKAAEECVKAVAKFLDVKEVIDRVRARNRWTVTDLEKVVRRATEVMGEELDIAWDVANYLHVWGFHEAKLDSESVEARVPYIEKVLKIIGEHLRKQRG